MIAPVGNHFMKNGSLMAGSDTNHPGAKDNIWCSVTQIKNNGLGDGSYKWQEHWRRWCYYFKRSSTYWCFS